MNGINAGNNSRTTVGVGISYEDVNWKEEEGQPFGIANHFNAIIFNDANNIVDSEGAMAVGGNFNSPRGLEVAYRGEDSLTKMGVPPDITRFLVGKNVSIGGPLVVSGHVIGNAGFRVGKGSTYFIGKDGSQNQEKELEYLYHQNGGSKYWKVSDKGRYFLISSYDVPRYIPAERIGAKINQFFEDGRRSILRQKQAIEQLKTNGMVLDNYHEWILRGNNRRQNVFSIDLRPNGILNKGIRAEVPAGSLVIVRIKTGNNAHLQYGLMGEKSRANDTLYVFEDAENIYMEVPADIWGSILAPQALFNAHSTGGHVSGNVAIRALAVNPNSGFEFHWYPFRGGVQYQPVPAVPQVPAAPIIPVPPVSPIVEMQPCPTCPEQKPCPSCPIPQPCPTCPEQKPCPAPQPCPTCPEQKPCPTCPEQKPCPTCPVPLPCPTCPTCPEQKPCPICPVPLPCPPCPTCPTCPPCPAQKKCPTCPEQKSCPIYKEKIIDTRLILYPVQEPCPDCPDCQIIAGKIIGCVWGCSCGRTHEWEAKLYNTCDGKECIISCMKLEYRDCFEFQVPYEGCYALTICPVVSKNRKSCRLCMPCQPYVTFKNIGVSNFRIF